MLVRNEIFEVVQNNPVLRNLAESKDVPVRISFRLARVLKALDENLKIYLSAKQKLIEKYCKRDEKGEPIVENNQYTIPPDNLETFQKEYFELLALEIDLGVDKIKAKFDDIPNGLVSTTDILFLEIFFDFEE